MPDCFVMEGNHGVFRPVGSVTLEQAVFQVRTAITFAVWKEVRDLLVDTTGLTGFLSPNTLQRFLMAVDWAEAAGGRVRMSMIAPAEMIDPEKFGVLVATNRGLISNVFTTEAEARAWLDAK